jgi:hypothetical protein
MHSDSGPIAGAPGCMWCVGGYKADHYGVMTMLGAVRLAFGNGLQTFSPDAVGACYCLHFLKCMFAAIGLWDRGLP